MNLLLASIQCLVNLSDGVFRIGKRCRHKLKRTSMLLHIILYILHHLLILLDFVTSLLKPLHELAVLGLELMKARFQGNKPLLLLCGVLISVPIHLKVLVLLLFERILTVSRIWSWKAAL